MSLTADQMDFLVERGLSAADLVEFARISEINTGDEFEPPAPYEFGGNRDVWVYVMMHDHPGAELVKVGISQNPDHRRKTLEKEHGKSLAVIFTEGPFTRKHAFAIERAAHGRLAATRDHGEWFVCGPDAATEAVLLSARGSIQ